MKVVKGTKFSYGMNKSWDVMCTLVTLVQPCVTHMQANRVSPKSSPHKENLYICASLR